eukprot:3938563-Rhodomonas_salina.1
MFAASVTTWVFPRNSPAVPCANMLVSMAELLLSVVVSCLSWMFWIERCEVTLFEAPAKIVENCRVAQGRLPEYEYHEDPEGDAFRDAQFAELRRILYVNQLEDILDDDNDRDGFFGSRIGVFGPDPFKWTFCSEKIALQCLPEMVPEIRLAIRLKSLKPFFDAWHDDTVRLAQKDLDLGLDTSSLKEDLQVEDTSILSETLLSGLLSCKSGESFPLVGEAVTQAAPFSWNFGLHNPTTHSTGTSAAHVPSLPSTSFMRGLLDESEAYGPPNSDTGSLKTSQRERILNTAPPQNPGTSSSDFLLSGFASKSVSVWRGFASCSPERRRERSSAARL